MILITDQKRKEEEIEDSFTEKVRSEVDRMKHVLSLFKQVVEHLDQSSGK